MPDRVIHRTAAIHRTHALDFETPFASRKPSMARHDPSREKLIEPNAQNRYEVAPADLPLSCPTPGLLLWNSHPRVYLPVEATGSARCPYCGAVYVLQGAAAHLV